MRVLFDRFFECRIKSLSLELSDALPCPSPGKTANLCSASFRAKPLVRDSPVKVSNWACASDRGHGWRQPRINHRWAQPCIWTNHAHPRSLYMYNCSAHHTMYLISLSLSVSLFLSLIKFSVAIIHCQASMCVQILPRYSCELNTKNYSLGLGGWNQLMSVLNLSLAEILVRKRSYSASGFFIWG